MSAHAIDPAAVPARIRDVARRVDARGGRALVVGGWVRDRLRGEAPVDLDLEVHGLEEAELDAALAEIGPVQTVGKAFAIRLVAGLDADVSWVAPTRRGLDDSFSEAALRRDLTINAMAFDPLSGRVLDPHGGLEDLERARLRATSPDRFGDDPVRALRTAGLAARLEMTPDDALVALCAEQDLGPVPGERLMLEWTRALTRARRPSLTLEWLQRMDQLRAFPEIDALRGVPQDPKWHPEGDVFVHTAMCLDAAATLREASDAPLTLMLATLCHDFGKPDTTSEEPDGRIRSIAHERAGRDPTRRFLRRLEASHRLIRQIEVLVDRHLAPVQLVGQGSGDKAFRKLVRRLDAARVSPKLLADVARADHLGRTTDDARAGRFEAGDRFLERVAALGIADGPKTAVVQGRHLVARGYSPGPEYGQILERCLALQDETGLDDPDAILDAVLRA